MVMTLALHCRCVVDSLTGMILQVCHRHRVLFQMWAIEFTDGIAAVRPPEFDPEDQS